MSNQNTTIPPSGRFWSNVDMSGGPDACWIWKLKKYKGYGQVKFNGRHRQAHCVAWELTNGPIPEGKCVCHDCPGGDNRACLNPKHLWLGTHQENMQDMVDKGRSLKGDMNPARRRIETRPRGSDHGKAITNESDVIQMRNLYYAGEFNSSQLAIRFGLSKCQTARILAGRVWKQILTPEHKAAAEKLQAQRKFLSAEQVREIRSSLESGMRVRDLARKFGKSRGLIEMIRDRKVHASVT